MNYDADRSCYIFMNNIYGAPQLLAMMVTAWNLREVGTYKANQSGKVSDKLPMNNDTVRDSYVRLVDKMFWNGNHKMERF